MSEHLEVPGRRHLAVIGNNPRRGAAPRPQTPVARRRRVRRREIDLFLASRRTTVPRRQTRRNGRERVVGGNKPFIETLSGDQEHEEAIRHLLPLYECQPPPLLIAVAPRRLAFGTISPETFSRLRIDRKE